jgi:hypothetical protein
MLYASTDTRYFPSTVLYFGYLTGDMISVEKGLPACPPAPAEPGPGSRSGPEPEAGPKPKAEPGSRT